MLLAVRGDLQSETGWSRATRAFVEAVSPDVDVLLGVDLHFNAARSTAQFPGLVLRSDAELSRLLAASRNSVVLHATLPDGIFCFPDAINIGWWFWETDRIPTDGDWPERLGSLDAMLVPSPWQKDVVERMGLGVPVFVAPWPHDMSAPSLDRSARAMDRLRHTVVHRPCSAELYLAGLDIDRRYHTTAEGRLAPGPLVDAKRAILDGCRTTLAEVLDAHDGYVFAVQSDAPRKGLAPLIREWCEYHRQASTRQALLVRYSSLNVTLDPVSVFMGFWETALMASAGSPAVEAIYLILTPLSDGDLGAVYGHATAFATATLGEGFGGTLVEATAMGCPIVAPDHTACGQIVPAAYAGSVASVPFIGAMVGQLPQQPANGTWHPPKPGAIAEKLRWVEQLGPDDREATVSELRRHMASTLAPSAVRAALASAVSAANAGRSQVSVRSSKRGLGA